MESEFGKDRLQWELAFYLAGFGLLAVLLIELCNAFDILEILYFIALVPLIGLTVLILAIISAVRKKQRQSLSRLVAVLAYCGISWMLWKDSMDLRPVERWLLHSNAYKAELMAQPIPPNGELRHMEWDGWGWAGMDTVVYLVYEPNDSLAPEARDDSKHNSKVISCGVWRVQRLEDHWYSVVFYTNTAWDDC